MADKSLNALAVTSPNGKTYYLHSRRQVLKNGHTVTLYHFAAKVGEGALSEVPAGYTLTFNAKTGLPILARKR